MFGKKKKQKNVAPAQPAVQVDYVPGEEYVYAQRSERPRRVKTVYGKVGGLTPVAKPADFVQLTPIVTPISIVPYLSQEQAVFTYSDAEEDEE